MAGHVQMCFADPVTSLPQVKAGTVRCLGVGSRGRYKLTPDIPTLNAQGIPDFELMTWTGVLMPAGAPATAMTPLRKAILETIAAPPMSTARHKAAPRSHPALPRRCGISRSPKSGSTAT